MMKPLRSGAWAALVHGSLLMASAQAAPVTDPNTVPATATTITFDEVILSNGQQVTDQFMAWGLVFGATPRTNYTTTQNWPGVTAPALDNFSGPNGNTDCPGVRTIQFTSPVRYVGFNIVTNGPDDTILSAYSGGVLVETFTFATDYDVEYFVGFDIPTGFDSLTVEIQNNFNACMVLDNVSLDFAYVCGDGVVDPGEQCDDGNANDNDDCPSTCVAAGCGDGLVHDQESGTEECDDGNADNNDDCLDTCLLATCGDGFLHDQGTGTEVCDDGNGNDNDDCPGNCLLPVCGDGYVYNEGAGTEACDDGAQNSDTTPDACRTDCTAPYCGDGITDSNEACDDAGANDDTAPDACRTNCALAGCGDQVLDTGEACDDGAGNSDDTADACRTTCTLAGCGDGVADTGEECDDGAGNDDAAADACRTDCVAAYCGDGVIDTGEACDDGAANDDAAGPCSATCTVVSGGGSVSGGCCRTSGAGPVPTLGQLALWFLVGLVLVYRRRRIRALV